MNSIVDDTRRLREAGKSVTSSTSKDEGAKTKSKQSQGLQDRVAQLYYSHGLFCSTYPVTIIFIAICVVLICCYPLLNLPLPGNSFTLTRRTINDSFKLISSDGDSPWCYIQQIVFRSAVVPWVQTLHLGDAFRAPLYESFKLLEVVRNYEDPKSLKTLGHVCLHVESLIKSKDERNNVFPEYSCLVLSPANLWQQDVEQFMRDNSILSTIFNHQNLQKGKISIAELLFGMHISETGIKRYPLRKRQRILQYAITLFLKDYDEEFILGLKNKLQKLYPLNQNLEENTTSVTNNEVIVLYYPDELNYAEYVPLISALLLLFIYYYFSVRKIELIKSKIGMAFTAVMTVLASLNMTLGLCFFFGLTLSLRVKEIFPYLIILVGLENVLILTKSVTSAPLHLDIKIRVAQGLSKEGWSITKTLLIEITILTIGLFTFVPAIQELCIFAIVGLLTDFFLQMVFFSTILSIDIKRKENLVEKNNLNFRNALYQGRFHYDKSLNTGMNRSKSHPKLTAVHTDVVASQNLPTEKRIPKRVKLVNIWARTRFFQRAFMFLMVVWIGRILYDSGIVENYFLDNRVAKNMTFSKPSRENIPSKFRSVFNRSLNLNFMSEEVTETDIMKQKNHTEELRKLRHPEYSSYLRLSAQHWPTVLKKYNISLSGQSIIILPSIKLSHAISPEQASMLRNSEEIDGQKFLQWQALAAALDPIDFTDLESELSSNNFLNFSERPFYPNSPMEIFLITILCIISVVVMSYTFFVLYRCICSRNYAEWRASWFDNSSNNKSEENEIPVLLEAVPIVLKGHPQEIECMVTDGFSAATSCLGGQIRVWDIVSGDLIAKINRSSSFNNMNTGRLPDINVDTGDDNLSDYESGSPASHEDTLSTFPSLQHKININFSGLRTRTDRISKEYDFGNDYRELYAEFQRLQHLKRRNNDTALWVHNQKQIILSSDYELENKVVCDIIEKDDFMRKSPKNLKSDFYCGTCSENRPSNECLLNQPSPIWCMDYVDNLIAIGTADGTLEFWEGTSGKFKCKHNDNCRVGITSVKIIGSRVIAVRLLGTVDFFQVQTFNQGRPVDWNFTSAYRRTHLRTASAGSISEIKNTRHEDCLEEIVCLKVMSLKAHQQPITCLDSEGGRVVTGSQDHTLKVFRLDNGSALYTLHGHYGPITSLFIDRICPATSGSGSQDGTLCVWDLLTGACMYSNKAHDGAITSLTYSASYVISLGLDDRLCIWERFQGHLLNTINISNMYATQVMMLTPNLLLTTRQGGLVVWDVRSGDCMRNITLEHSSINLVNQMLMLRDAVMCDFGNELRIVRFPIITHKLD